MKILLTDDSSTMRKIQMRALKALDIDEIVEAGNGKEALNILKQHDYQFDFVMMDINMPEMSGIEALTKLREIKTKDELPVIMCTSVAEKGQVVEALKAGANQYVVKPFRPDDLQAKIKGVMGI